jgi:hypothetical protein
MAKPPRLRVIGKTEQDAIKAIAELELRVRISKRDGIPNVLTRDRRPDRINLEVESGVVVGASIG